MYSTAGSRPNVPSSSGKSLASKASRGSLCPDVRRKTARLSGDDGKESYGHASIWCPNIPQFAQMCLDPPFNSVLLAIRRWRGAGDSDVGISGGGDVVMTGTVGAGDGDGDSDGGAIG